MALIIQKSLYPPVPRNKSMNGLLKVIALVFIVAVAGCISSTPGTTGLATLSFAGQPALGAKEANVTVIEYSDFQCPYCSRAVPVVDAMLKQYDGKINIEYVNYPLPFHQYAYKAAEASECALDQGKFWEYHDLLFEHQDALTADDLKGYAKTLGLDTAKFDSCLDNGDKRSAVESDIAQAKRAGVSGTPTFVIGNTKVVGADAQKLDDAIQAALSQQAN